MFSSNPEAVAIDAAHGLAFHRGLGTSITPSSTSPSDKYLTAEAVAEYAKNAYAKSNIALVGSGPSSSDLSQSVSQFFQGVPSTGSGSSAYKVQDNGASKYHGGEQRIASKAGNAFVLAFPGSSAFGTAGYKPAVDVLAALLGGESTIKWTPGFSLLSQATKDASRQVQVSTSNHSYSDAGLLTVSLTGNVDKVASTGKTVVDVLKKVAAGEVPADEVKKAAAYAKFRALESIQTLETGLEASGSALINNAKPYQVTEIAQSLDKVTEQNVKEVSSPFSPFSVLDIGQKLMIRPPNPSWAARRPSWLWVICSSCRMLRIWVLPFNGVGSRNMYTYIRVVYLFISVTRSGINQASVRRSSYQLLFILVSISLNI